MNYDSFLRISIHECRKSEGVPKNTFFRLRDEKQEGVLRAAIHEFTEHGFERTKIGDIAKRAGVATGSIYQYFEDKKALFVYCAEWSLGVFMKKLDTRSDVKNMDIYEYFQDSVSNAEVIAEERDLAIFLQTLSREPGLMDASMKAMYDVSKNYIKALIQNSKDKGLVRTDIDSEILTEYFIAVTERFRMRWVEQNVDFLDMDVQKQGIQKEIGQMLELLKKGMGG